MLGPKSLLTTMRPSTIYSEEPQRPPRIDDIDEDLWDTQRPAGESEFFRHLTRTSSFNSPKHLRRQSDEFGSLSALYSYSVKNLGTYQHRFHNASHRRRTIDDSRTQRKILTPSLEEHYRLADEQCATLERTIRVEMGILKGIAKRMSDAGRF